MAKILTKKQQLALNLISKTNLSNFFYFTGGTALSHYYLQHRFSEDLDFFNYSEFDPQSVTAIIKSLKNKLQYKSFDYQNSFNRNIYFLDFDKNHNLKLEFTYYPFKQIENPKKIDGLLIDSIIDIATNKLFTIAQKPRGRDFFDLYCIIQKFNYKIEDLRMKAKLKFDWDVDQLQLASRFFEVDQHLDDPILLKKIKRNLVTNFFKSQANKMKTAILK